MSYKIFLHALGDVGEEIITIDRDHHDHQRLAYNMLMLYVWNIRGIQGFESDGPCVFITF